jgi:hypothetical protein
MSAPKQPSLDDSDGHDSAALSQVEDLVSRLTLETRLHAELRKNHEGMIESSEEYIKSLQEEMEALDQKHLHEREKLQDIISGLTIKCQMLESRKEFCESVEDLSLIKMRELNSLEDEIESREDAFYSRQSKAYRRATQKYHESVIETSQSIAQEAVLAYLDTHAHPQSNHVQNQGHQLGDKGKSLRSTVSHKDVKVDVLFVSS